jgi:hypothetical protein
MNAKNIIVVILGITLTTMLATSVLQHSSYAVFNSKKGEPAVPISAGDNVYIVWGSNKTGHPEVMFRASTDGGKIFSDKLNLSNSSQSDSTDAAVTAGGNQVSVTWWETNETSAEPLVRTSSDNGQTFGPAMNLATNGTIGSK